MLVPKSLSCNIKKVFLTEDDGNIPDQESDDSTGLSIKSFESSVVELKSKIFSTHYYEEIWDFDVVKQGIPQDIADLSSFQSKPTQPRRSSRRSSTSVRRRTYSEESESSIFSRNLDY